MNFDKNFFTYNKNAIVQKETAFILSKFLPEDIGQYKKILELGCGTGFFTRELIKKVSAENLILNDFYNTEKYFREINYKKFLTGDMINFLNEPYDLIVSSSCFQWSNDLEFLIKSISNCTNNLVFSIYLTGNMQEIKNHFGVGLKYHNKEEIEDILRKYFENVNSFEKETILFFDTPFEALQHIKKTGTSMKTKVPISKIKSYTEKKLTYRVGCFSATKKS